MNSYILFLVLIFLCLFIYGKNIVFHPRKVNTIYSKNSEGVSYLFINKNSDTTLFICNGNSNIIDDNLKIFSEFPYNLCLYDYYNYGSSDNTFAGIYLMSDRHLVNAGRSVLKSLNSQKLLSKNIVFIGISLGSHPATVLASEFSQNNSKLILLVPFDHLSSFWTFGFWRFLGAFDNLTPAKKITQQVLIVKGIYDKLIPSICAENLHEKFYNSELFKIDCDHNNWTSINSIGKVVIKNELYNKLITFINS